MNLELYKVIEENDRVSKENHKELYGKVTQAYQYPVQEIARYKKGKYSRKKEIYIEATGVVEAIEKYQRKGKPAVGVLNFANAYTPGGGYRTASIAQEEVLCYNTNLEDLLRNLCAGWYTRNQEERALGVSTLVGLQGVTKLRKLITPGLYGELQPVYSCPQINVVTAPAIDFRTHAQTQEAYAYMYASMQTQLAMLADMGSEIIILGAWGCGVFLGDPQKVSSMYAQLLEGETRFRKIIFAIPHVESPNYQAFKQAFCAKGLVDSQGQARRRRRKKQKNICPRK